MTNRDEQASDDEHSGAPVDFDRLDVIADRCRTDDRFKDIDRQPAFAPDRIVLTYDPGFYPESVDTARLEIVWYENGDFSVHYHEETIEGSFDHRWDRHPSEHNARDHIHPGPDAPTPGTDASDPNDWRDVFSLVLEEIEERQRAFWTDT
ncbi:hypothetical protein [Natranaeroarchaeum aerophilus]|uniref:Uncharacterized protein n=1 Tax=Natranaeroarchaeum aerophilus TaxID=2917711 RepID=A0AAE3FPJ4_9EURY|nr:hypothetical protein [Natranaeroarchaeum aerophilus]MCL9812993.1 hypothetical protein [Natranaeroarchaeum aerophilus]